MPETNREKNAFLKSKQGNTTVLGVVLFRGFCATIFAVKNFSHNSLVPTAVHSTHTPQFSDK